MPKHEINKITEYANQGYTSSYKMKEDKIYDIENDISFGSDKVHIVDEYRYEGMSNPNDMSILYILEVPGKSKGTLLLPYGPNADAELGWFMKEVSLNNINKDKTKLKKL